MWILIWARRCTPFYFAPCPKKANLQIKFAFPITRVPEDPSSAVVEMNSRLSSTQGHPRFFFLSSWDVRWLIDWFGDARSAKTAKRNHRRVAPGNQNVECDVYERTDRCASQHKCQATAGVSIWSTVCVCKRQKDDFPPIASCCMPQILFFPLLKRFQHFSLVPCMLDNPTCLMLALDTLPDIRCTCCLPTCLLDIPCCVSSRCIDILAFLYCFHRLTELTRLGELFFFLRFLALLCFDCLSFDHS